MHIPWLASKPSLFKEKEADQKKIRPFSGGHLHLYYVQEAFDLASAPRCEQAACEVDTDTVDAQVHRCVKI